MGARQFDHDTAYHIQDYAAAALWLPPEVHPEEDALIALFQETLSEQQQEQAWEVLEQLDSYHPNEPHWYLPVIGGDPIRQRKGYGAELMKHALIACDREGVPAYLESSNPENISLYARHGFEILGMIQTGMMPPLIPRLRKPQE